MEFTDSSEGDKKKQEMVVQLKQAWNERRLAERMKLQKIYMSSCDNI